MSYAIIIPARYHSTRLPGKPLLDIAGKPMIQHVYERAVTCGAAEVIVATDDQRIVDSVQSFGGQVLLTDAQHQSGTDRLQEVAKIKNYDDEQVIVNLQGDEPLLSVNAIEQVAKNIAENPDCGIATLCEKIDQPNEIRDPNIVKVVRTINKRALYFSRSVVPHMRSSDITGNALIRQDSEPRWYRHIGIYAYRVSTLHQYVGWQPASIEIAESLEQLRALYHGISIHCDDCIDTVPGGVDTPEDLERVRHVFNVHNNT